MSTETQSRVTWLGPQQKGSDMQSVFERSVAPVVSGPSLNPRHEVVDLIRLGFEIETGKSVTITRRDRIFLLQIGRSAPVSVVVREKGEDFLSIDFGLNLGSSSRNAVLTLGNNGGEITFREKYPTHFVKAPFGFYMVDWSGSDIATRQLRPRIPTFHSCAGLLGFDPQHVLESSEVLSSPTIW